MGGQKLIYEWTLMDMNSPTILFSYHFDNVEFFLGLGHQKFGGEVDDFRGGSEFDIETFWNPRGVEV